MEDIMKQLTVKFSDEVKDETIQQYAAAALAIPGAIGVVIGAEDDRKKVMYDLLATLFGPNAPHV